MEIGEMQARAVAVRARFAEFEIASYGREWSTAELVMGLMTDLGDLAAAVQRVDGVRPRRVAEPIDELRHEIADCLWVLLVLADRYGIDSADAFADTMDELDQWLETNTPKL